MGPIKRWFLELKRVRWPSAKEGAKTFFTSTAFIVISSLVLFGIAIAFASLWAAGGLGI